MPYVNDIPESELTDWMHEMLERALTCDHDWQKHAFCTTTSGRVLLWELRCPKCYACRALPKPPTLFQRAGALWRKLFSRKEPNHV